MLVLSTYRNDSYISTYLPVEMYKPERPLYRGYDEHTQGQWYFLQGYERKGLSYLEHAAQQGYVPAYRRLGDIYHYKKNQPERAKEYYTMAADQGDILALESLADMHLQENNLQKAVEYYEKLALKNPTFWLTVSTIYRQLGEQKKSAQALKKYEEFHEYYYWHR